jgi:hypothetical protein
VLSVSRTVGCCSLTFVGKNLSLSHCFSTVHDPDQALAFHRDALGLESRHDVASEDSAG